MASTTENNRRPIELYTSGQSSSLKAPRNNISDPHHRDLTSHIKEETNFKDPKGELTASISYLLDNVDPEDASFLIRKRIQAFVGTKFDLAKSLVAGSNYYREILNELSYEELQLLLQSIITTARQGLYSRPKTLNAIGRVQDRKPELTSQNALESAYSTLGTFLQGELLREEDKQYAQANTEFPYRPLEKREIKFAGEPVGPILAEYLAKLKDEKKKLDYIYKVRHILIAKNKISLHQQQELLLLVENLAEDFYDEGQGNITDAIVKKLEDVNYVFSESYRKRTEEKRYEQANTAYPYRPLEEREFDAAKKPAGPIFKEFLPKLTNKERQLAFTFRIRDILLRKMSVFKTQEELLRRADRLADALELEGQYDAEKTIRDRVNEAGYKSVRKTKQVESLAKVNPLLLRVRDWIKELFKFKPRPQVFMPDNDVDMQHLDVPSSIARKVETETKEQKESNLEELTTRLGDAQNSYPGQGVEQQLSNLEELTMRLGDRKDDFPQQGIEQQQYALPSQSRILPGFERSKGPKLSIEEPDKVGYIPNSLKVR